MILIVSIFVLFPNKIASREMNFLTRQAKNASKGGPLVKFHQNFDQANYEPLERAIKMLQYDTTTTS